MYRNDKGENIYYLNRNAGGQLLNIYMAGETFPNPVYRITHNTESSHRWDMYVFEYVISGMGYIEDDEGKHRVTGGDFYFLNKMRRHIYYSDANEPFRKLFIVFSGVLADRLISVYGIGGSIVIKKINAEDKMREILTLLNNSGDIIGSEASNRTALLLHEIIQLLSDYGEMSGVYASDTKKPLAERIMEYLNVNVYNPHGLDDAENYFFVSKEHIINVFKREYNITPMKYVQKKRAECAAYLLETTELGIKEIASLLRFSDSKTFSKSFSAIYKIPPSVYREQSKPGKSDKNRRLHT